MKVTIFNNTFCKSTKNNFENIPCNFFDRTRNWQKDIDFIGFEENAAGVYFFEISKDNIEKYIDETFIEIRFNKDIGEWEYVNNENIKSVKYISTKMDKVDDYSGIPLNVFEVI